jgi:hypothetical protein
MSIPMVLQNRWTEAKTQALIGAFAKIADDHPHKLVVMKFTDSPAPYTKGQLAGIPPDMAARYYRFKVAIPVDHQGAEIPVTGFDRSEAPAQPAASNAVEIPAAWYGIHHLQRLKLAKALGGGESLTVPQADDIIAKEVERRKSEGVLTDDV